MHCLIFGHSFAELVALILLPGLAFYFLNKKKASVRGNAEDADTGASGSSTALTETNFDGSSSSPTKTNNGTTSGASIETNNDASSLSPIETNSGGSISSPAETNNGASSSSPTETNNSASSSLATSNRNCYEVFLSFRGLDTRHGFTDHLYDRLCEARIHVFRDDDDLCHGKDIRSELMAAITNSKILIPIFSENYGTSRWCLDELVQIVERKNNNQQIVLPIFYKVKPTNVRHQTGSFGKAFFEHMGSFDQMILEKWKKALEEVSTLRAYEVDGYEAKWVKLIVRKVLSELKKKFELITPENLVGIDSHVENIMEFVNNKSDKTLVVGIHGMGGIGKTTLAKTIYNQLLNQFEHCCFIADVRESWKHNGIHHLQNKLIYHIFKRENEVHNEDEGIKFISSNFKNKKVLVLLDDVDNVIQLKHLAGNHDWFSLGSKIIITTRNKRILEVVDVDYKYDLKELEYNQSVILFSKHAFRMDSPPSEFETLTHKVVSTTGGLPLSLKVLGSLLCGQKSTQWIDTINKLEKVSRIEVQERLRISYEALEPEQKQIFLDIACFFIGTDKRIAYYMWDACGFFPGENIETLIFLSLIKVGDNHELRMHDQLRDLGRTIVHREEEQEPWHRSRLWDSKEALKVLNRNKGTEKIKAIQMNEGSSKGFDKTAYTAEQFKNLTNLRFLYMKGAHLSGDFKGLMKELKWLRWQKCPRNFEVNNFHMEDLAVLELPYSEINEKWEGWNFFTMTQKLQYLDLSNCESLENTDFLSAFKKLEVLILNYCKRLKRIDFSSGDMKALLRLELRYCESLTELPAEIGKLKALQQLLLYETRSLSALPDSIGCLKNLEILDITGSGVGELPNGIARLSNLRELRASFCFNLKGVMAESMCNLSSLQHLDFSYSNKLQSLPDLPSSLTYLGVTCRSRKLPSLSHLAHLKKLQVFNCRNLECMQLLPSMLLKKLEVLVLHECGKLKRINASIGDMEALLYLAVTNCKSLTELPVEIAFMKLKDLSLNGCTRLKRIDASIGDMETLVRLNLPWCKSLTELPVEIGKLKALQKLNLKDTQSLFALPDSIGSLENLEILDISDSAIKELPNGIGRLRKLRELDACGCENLQRIMIESMSNLSSLRRLDFRYCNKLKSLPDLPSGLTYLGITCQSHKLPSLSHLAHLKELKVFDCNLECIRVLPSNSECSQPTDIEESESPQSLNAPFKLELLDVSYCGSIETLDVSQFIHLRTLSAWRCKNLLEVRGLDKLIYLESLTVQDCNLVEWLDLPKFDCLKKLDASYCKKLAKIQGLDKLEYLESLDIGWCTSMEMLYLPKFERLKRLEATSCEKLAEIQGLNRLEYLESLDISRCTSIEKLDLPKFGRLKKLNASGCKNLVEIQGLNSLEYLESLDISSCTSIGRLDLPKSGSMKILIARDCKNLVESQGLDGLESLEK